jgi:hypothetical protein
VEHKFQDADLGGLGNKKAADLRITAAY